MRIILLCPSDDAPTGGVKVIYRHCELLNGLGADAVVMHPFDHHFRCTWFDHTARFADGPELDRRRDFVIVPELWALPFGRQCLEAGVRYAILVQNGYLTHTLLAGHTRASLEPVYLSADLILSISADSTRMVASNYPGILAQRVLPVRYSIAQQFHAEKCRDQQTLQRRIAYMPRKLADHAERVIYALSARLPPGWEIVAIENASESSVARTLLASSIFMSFSSLEGLPLPPLEAAIAGNLVIGYTGQGAKEYWLPTNFIEIHQGNLIGFIDAVAEAAHEFESGSLDTDSLYSGSATLAADFSVVSEMSVLACIFVRIANLYRDTETGPAGVQPLIAAM